MKVVVTGIEGQLGTALRQALSHAELVGPTFDELDIRDADQVRDVLSTANPDVIIHGAAMTAVDQCEVEAELAFSVNAIGTLNVARVARELGAPVAYVSTDYVFGADLGRDHPYTEDDPTGPLNVYGASKLAGEHLLRATADGWVVRTQWVYGRSSLPASNFVETMLRLAREGRSLSVVDDQVGSPTFASDLAKSLVGLVSQAPFGTYHVTNGGTCTWYDFAREIWRLAGLSPEARPTTTEAYGAPAKRPAYSVLGGNHLSEAGLPELRHWTEALEEYVRDDE